MASILKTSINLNAIPKDKIINGKKGKYLPITITVNDPPIYFEKYVMVEDFTGTWCGWCPRISYAIEKLEEETDDAVIVAAHQGDPMQFSQITALMNAFGVTGFPTGIINRTANWNYPQPNNISQVTLQLYEPNLMVPPLFSISFWFSIMSITG